MGEVAGKEQINTNISTLILPGQSTEIGEDKGNRSIGPVFILKIRELRDPKFKKFALIHTWHL